VNKKITLIIVVLVILVLAGVGYKFLGQKTSPTIPPTTVAKPTAAAENVVSGTLKSLFSGGKTETCTIIYPNNQGTGTVYIDGKKFSGDFTIKGATGAEMTGHTVSDGTYIYFWSDGSTRGMKMKIQSTNAQPTGTQQQGSINLNQKVSYKCAPGTDSSKFTIPTNIQFMDLSGLTGGSKIPAAVTGGTNVAPQTGTSPCDSISNPTAKAACENAVKNAGQ
jgi:hypothetical protein